MKKIPLTKGHWAIVDDEDFPILSQHKWYAAEGQSGTKAVRNRPVLYMHRFLMQAPKGMEVDHINGNTLDNRRANLRICTRSQNAMNTKVKSTSTTGIKGIGWHKGNKAWRIRIVVNGNRFERYTRTLQEAQGIYRKLEAKYHGEFGYYKSRELTS